MDTKAQSRTIETAADRVTITAHRMDDLAEAALDATERRFGLLSPAEVRRAVGDEQTESEMSAEINDAVGYEGPGGIAWRWWDE